MYIIMNIDCEGIFRFWNSTALSFALESSLHFNQKVPNRIIYTNTKSDHPVSNMDSVNNA